MTDPCALLINIFPSSSRCFYDGCKMPTPPPPPSGRPSEGTLKWSAKADWADSPDGYGGHGGVLPKSGDDVMILDTWWMVSTFFETQVWK